MPRCCHSRKISPLDLHSALLHLRKLGAQISKVLRFIWRPCTCTHHLFAPYSMLHTKSSICKPRMEPPRDLAPCVCHLPASVSCCSDDRCKISSAKACARNTIYYMKASMPTFSPLELRTCIVVSIHFLFSLFQSLGIEHSRNNGENPAQGDYSGD